MIKTLLLSYGYGELSSTRPRAGAQSRAELRRVAQGAQRRVTRAEARNARRVAQGAHIGARAFRAMRAFARRGLVASGGDGVLVGYTYQKHIAHLISLWWIVGIFALTL